MVIRNVTYSIQDGKLYIEVPLHADLGKSKSGLSVILASATGCLLKGADGARLNLLLYRPFTKQQLRDMVQPGVEGEVVGVEEQAGGAGCA